LCIICDKSKLDEQGCNGAPDLIVEILSPSNSKYDLNTKFDLYEEAGVLEYWIVNPMEKTILVYSLKDGKYYGLSPKTEDNEIASILFPEMKFHLEEVFLDN